MYAYFLTYLRITYVHGHFSLNKLRNQPDIFQNGFLNTTKFLNFYLLRNSPLRVLSASLLRHIDTIGLL